MQAARSQVMWIPPWHHDELCWRRYVTVRACLSDLMNYICLVAGLARDIYGRKRDTAIPKEKNMQLFR